jgi:hypothetical protein
MAPEFASKGSSKGTAVSFGPDQSTLSTGLVGYWKMDETATPATDSSGNGNSGTWTGNATNITGKFGNGITLDGSGDYINVANSTSIQNLPTGNFTVSAWIRTPSNWSLPTLTQQSIFVGKTTGANTGWQLFNQNNGKPTFSIFFDNTNATAKDDNVCTWYLLVFTSTIKHLYKW